MHRFAFGLVLIGTSISMIFPSSAMAFDLDTNAVTTPDSTTQFKDPDEAPLPAPLPSAHLQDDGTSRSAHYWPSDSPWDKPSNHHGERLSDFARDGSSDVPY